MTIAWDADMDAALIDGIANRKGLQWTADRVGVSVPTLVRRRDFLGLNSPARLLSPDALSAKIIGALAFGPLTNKDLQESTGERSAYIARSCAVLFQKNIIRKIRPNGRGGRMAYALQTEPATLPHHPQQNPSHQVIRQLANGDAGQGAGRVHASEIAHG